MFNFSCLTNEDKMEESNTTNMRNGNIYCNDSLEYKKGKNLVCHEYNSKDNWFSSTGWNYQDYRKAKKNEF